MLETIRRRAKELGIEQATIFLGFTPHWQFADLLNATDIVCLPSRSEPFGITLLEAWAAGKPVVATNVGGLEENIENFVNGVKVSPTAESVAWGINYLLNTPNGMKKIAEQGMKSVEQFSWKNNLTKLLNTYEKVLNKKPRD